MRLHHARRREPLRENDAGENYSNAWRSEWCNGGRQRDNVVVASHKQQRGGGDHRKTESIKKWVIEPPADLVFRGFCLALRPSVSAFLCSYERGTIEGESLQRRCVTAGSHPASKRDACCYVLGAHIEGGCSRRVRPRPPRWLRFTFFVSF